jgi:hypothetical protein
VAFGKRLNPLAKHIEAAQRQGPGEPGNQAVSSRSATGADRRKASKEQIP